LDVDQIVERESDGARDWVEGDADIVPISVGHGE